MNIAAAQNLFLKRIAARFLLQRDKFNLTVDFNIPSQGVTALFGMSGSGKTTLLRCIAGLEIAQQGLLKIDDDIWQDENRFVPVHKRRVGYVFQDSNLFDHLTVEQNLLYGFKRLRRKNLISVNQVVNFLNLDSLLHQFPMELSGGQKQRVAIARALLSNPRLLLMDEPLASLDLQAKHEILPYLDALSREFEIPIIYVSHSPDEVIRIADHLVLLEKGRIVASGPTNELFTRMDLPLAHIEESGAVVHGRIFAHDTKFHLTYVSIAGGRVAISASAHKQSIGDNVKVRILARDVSLTRIPAESSSISNVFPVRIAAITPTHDPAKVLVKLDMGGENLLAQITLKSCTQLGLVLDQIVYAQVKSVALMR